jgi:uncharacterized protein DUF3859
MRTFPILMIFFLTSVSAVAEAATAVRIDVREFGIFAGRVGKITKNESTAAGFTASASPLKLVKQTDTIPARRGLRFGVKYLVVGHPKGADILIKWVTRFPSAGLTNGKGQKFEKNEFSQRAVIGTSNYRTYAFDEAWELVPGEWIFEFFYKEDKIGEKRFIVVKE